MNSLDTVSASKNNNTERTAHSLSVMCDGSVDSWVLDA